MALNHRIFKVFQIKTNAPLFIMNCREGYKSNINPLGSYINNATATFPISGTAEAGSQVSAVSKVIDS